MKTWVGLFTQITTKILLRLDIFLERLSPTELSPEVPSIMTFINYTDENLFSAAGSHKYTRILGAELDQRELVTLIQFQHTLFGFLIGRE